MTKYVKLNKQRTKWNSALYQVKPANVRRHPDEILPQYNWFPVEEHKKQLPDQEIYYHAVDDWEVIDGVVHIYYNPTLISLDRRRQILSDRVTDIRNRRLASGLTFMGFPFDTKESTYKLVLGVTIKALSDPTYTTYWITEDNRRIKMNAEQIMAFGSAYERFQNEHFMKSRDLKDDISISYYPEQIDINNGWPSAEYYPDFQPLEVLE